MKASRTLSIFVIAFNLAAAAAKSQTLDLIGVTALRYATTNLNGSGIRVAHPEAGWPYFEVNPSVVGQPTNLFTYIASNGTASTFTNSLGLESTHANDVGNHFYGMANGVATNLAHVDNFEANHFLDNFVFSSPTHAITNVIVNQSYSFGPQTAAVQQSYDSVYDNYSTSYKVLFISAADNYGTSYPSSTNVALPGTTYNCISVGAYKNGQSYNSIGPTIDNGRCKPDITAWADATSYSTPQISGAAAVLMQAALRGDGGSDTNSAFDIRTIKALLLNGAVKPVNWTNSPASPLDARHGAGLVNVLNSYKQMAGGKQGSIVSNQVSAGSAHPPTGNSASVSSLIGWDFATNISSAAPARDAIYHYYFNVTNANPAAKYYGLATLVWNRQLNKTAINNLDLFLYNCANSNLVLSSTSLVDNVEHLYLTNLPQGRYDLQVWKAGGAGIVSASEAYALAWQFVPTPTLALTNWGGNTSLAWPPYPAGFLAEANINLTATGNWSSSQLPLVILTNGMNSILLNTTNAAQFFRLRSPNF